MSLATSMTTRIDNSARVMGALLLVVGIALAVVGMGMSGGDANALAHAYLFGWVYWAALTLGCLGITLLHHCARGEWGFPTVRIFEAGGGPINAALFGALFLPVMFLWKKVFYPWANPEEVAGDKILQHKAVWFQTWEVRIIAFFLVFALLAHLNKTWLKREEQTGDDAWWKKRQYFGGLFLVVFTLCFNFLWTDVLMSQYPHWYSTIFGVWILVGGVLCAFAFSAIVLGTQSSKKPYDTAAQPWLIKDIGNWMLAFTMLWAYFSLSQYLIIWSGNLNEFTSYFIDRSADVGWLWHGRILIASNFFIPFTLLLAPRTKRVPMILAGVGVYTMVARFIDLWWVVMPTWKKTWGISALDIGVLLAMGGIWLLLWSWQFSRSPILTYRFPKLKEATHE